MFDATALMVPKLEIDFLLKNPPKWLVFDV